MFLTLRTVQSCRMGRRGPPILKLVGHRAGADPGLRFLPWECPVAASRAMIRRPCDDLNVEASACRANTSMAP